MSECIERREIIAFPDDTYVEAWVGYRQWNMLVGNGRVRLHPITSTARVRGRKAWEPGAINTAQCLCVDHDAAPRCGFHAWMAQPKMMLMRPHVVWGEAYLWGDVNIFEKGYRAQHAMVAGLYVFDGMSERNRLLVELAALQYKVPIVAPRLVAMPWPAQPGSSRLTA